MTTTPSIVVCLHAPDEVRYKTHHVPSLQDIAVKYNATSIQIPGFDYPLEDDENLLGAIFRKLSETIQGRPVHIIAHSFSAFFAILYAHSHPQLVTGLTLYAPVGLVPCFPTHWGLYYRHIVAHCWPFKCSDGFRFISKRYLTCSGRIWTDPAINYLATYPNRVTVIFGEKDTLVPPDISIVLKTIRPDIMIYKKRHATHHDLDGFLVPLINRSGCPTAPIDMNFNLYTSFTFKENYDKFFDHIISEKIKSSKLSKRSERIQIMETVEESDENDAG